MSRLSDIIYVVGIIGFWEGLNLLVKYLKSHKHKWINLGTNKEDWQSHLESNIEGGWHSIGSNMMNLLELYTEGQYCLSCGTYSFLKMNAEGKVESKLNFHQRWGSFAKEVGE